MFIAPDVETLSAPFEGAEGVLNSTSQVGFRSLERSWKGLWPLNYKHGTPTGVINGMHLSDVRHDFKTGSRKKEIAEDITRS